MRQGTDLKTVLIQYPAGVDENGKFTEKRAFKMETKNGREVEVPLVERIALKDLERAQKEFGAVVYRSGMPRGQRVAARIADFLPTVGGLLGEGVGTVAGAVGGAGAASVPLAIGGRMAGGGIGSGLGQAAREGIYRLAGMGDAPGTVLGEAALGAGSSLVGQGLAKGGKFVGKALLTSSVGSNALMKGEKILEDMVSTNTPVGKVFREGSERAASIVKQTGERLDKMIRRTPASRQMSSKAMRKPGTKLIRNAEKYGEEGDIKLLERLRERVDTSINPRTGLRQPRVSPATADEVRALRQKYDSKIDSYWKSTGSVSGRGPVNALPPKERFYHDTANALRAWLYKNVPSMRVVPKQSIIGKVKEKVAEKMFGKPSGPIKMTYRQASNLSQRAMQMKKAIEEGQKVSGLKKLGTGGAATLATTGVGIGAGLGALQGGDFSPMAAGGAAGLLLQMNPQIASRLGLLLAREGGQTLLSTAPYLARSIYGPSLASSNEYGIESATGPAPQYLLPAPADATRTDQQ